MITFSAKAARRPTAHPRPTESGLLFTAIVAALLCAAATFLTRTATAQDVTWVNGVNGAIAGNSVEKKGSNFATYSSNWNVVRGRNDLFITPFEAALTAPQSTTPAGEVVWVEDVVPTGGTATSDSEGWNWVSGNPAPFSGSSAHQSNIYSGPHQHFFYNAANTLTVNAGDTLFTYVYLDPNNLPGEVGRVHIFQHPFEQADWLMSIG